MQLKYESKSNIKVRMKASKQTNKQKQIVKKKQKCIFTVSAQDNEKFDKFVYRVNRKH